MTSKERADVTTFRHHSFRFMMISRKFSKCFASEALSVYPHADRSGEAMSADAPSMMTSVAISPLRWTDDAPSGIFCPGSVMIVNRIPRAIACSIFLPTFSRISENVGVETMHVSDDWSISSAIFSRTRGFVTIVYTSCGSPFDRRTSWRRSSLLNVSSRCSITRPLTLPGASGLKIVGRPRVEIANPFWHRLCKTLYADVRGMWAVSAIVSALPYPWATSAMYPRASYPERPIDSSVFVARSNSCSSSTPPASIFDKSCETTGPRYPRAVFIFSNRRAQCWISKRDASLYPTGAFLRGHGFGAPSRPGCDSLPLDLLERFHSCGRPGSSGPHGRHDRLRTLRDLGPERRRSRDVDADRREGGGSSRENRGHVRHVRSDSSGLPPLPPRPVRRTGPDPPS